MTRKQDKTSREALAATSATPAEAPARRKPGPKPGTEAAKRGGTAARDKYGREFYSKIGAKGGSTVRDRHGSAFYTEIGRRGGEATKRTRGIEHYSRIGRIGGQRARRRRGREAGIGRHEQISVDESMTWHGCRRGPRTRLHAA